MNHSLPAALLLWGCIGFSVFAAESSAPEALVLNNLGALEYSRGHYAQAQPLLEKSVALYRATRDADPLDFSKALLNLAAAHRAQAHFLPAESLYKECLEVRERALPANDAALAAPLDGLSRIYLAAGDMAKAEEFGRRALKAADHAANNAAADHAGANNAAADHAGADNATELNSSLNHLAVVLSARGANTDAAALAWRAQDVAESNFGALSRQYADGASVLAMIAKSRGQLAEAEMRSRIAVETYEMSAGPGHPLTLVARKNLAGILGAEGKYKPARVLLEQVIEDLPKAYGLDHPDVISAVRDLARLESDQKHYGQAAELFRQVHDADLRNFGAANPQTRFDLNDLGSVAFARHHLREAEELFVRASPAKHGDVRDSIVKANLSKVYQEEKRSDDAARLYREAIEEFERDGRSEDPRLGGILASYAGLLRAAGDYAQAEKLQARATALQVRGVLARDGHAS